MSLGIGKSEGRGDRTPFLRGRAVGRNDNVWLPNPATAQTRPSGTDLLQSVISVLAAVPTRSNRPRMACRAGPALHCLAPLHFFTDDPAFKKSSSCRQRLAPNR